MDFVKDALVSGCRIKCLTFGDDFTEEYLTITAAFGISGVHAKRILNSIALFRGYPTTIRTNLSHAMATSIWAWSGTAAYSARQAKLKRFYSEF